MVVFWLVAAAIVIIAIVIVHFSDFPGMTCPTCGKKDRLPCTVSPDSQCVATVAPTS